MNFGIKPVGENFDDTVSSLMEIIRKAIAKEVALGKTSTYALAVHRGPVRDQAVRILKKLGYVVGDSLEYELEISWAPKSSVVIE